MKTKVYISRHPYFPRLQVHMHMDDGRNFYVFKPAEKVVIGDNEAAQEFLEIDPDVAQQFMDQLWTCGIRPSEGTGSAGQLAATERHLGDMQRITFGLLKKHGVGA